MRLATCSWGEGTIQFAAFVPRDGVPLNFCDVPHEGAVLRECDVKFEGNAMCHIKVLLMYLTRVPYQGAAMWHTWLS